MGDIVVHRLAGCGHQFGNDLSGIAADVLRLV
jgi:hypothetical protein